MQNNEAEKIELELTRRGSRYTRSRRRRFD